MAVVIRAPDDPAKCQFAWNGVNINWITSDTQLSVGRITGIYQFDGDGNALGNFNKEAIQDLINRAWSGGPDPFPPGFSKPPPR